MFDEDLNSSRHLGPMSTNSSKNSLICCGQVGETFRYLFCYWRNLLQISLCLQLVKFPVELAFRKC